MVKEYLRSIGVMQRFVAEKLQLSRPTLDAYIEMFESGKPLPKDNYNYYFSLLFSEPKSQGEFMHTLDQISMQIGDSFEKRRNLNAHICSELISDIRGCIEEDLASGNYNKDIYLYIKYLIANYQDEPVWSLICNYFLTVNGRNDINQFSEADIAFMSQLYGLIMAYKDGTLESNRGLERAFLNRRRNIIRAREEKEQTIRQNLIENLDKIMQDKSQKGETISEKEILAELMKISRDR